MLWFLSYFAFHLFICPQNIAKNEFCGQDAEYAYGGTWEKGWCEVGKKKKKKELSKRSKN